MDMRGGICYGLLVAVALLACDRNPSDASVALTAACEPAVPQNPRDILLGNLDGTFSIVFVATSGPQARRTAPGTLILRPQESELVLLEQVDTSAVVSQPVIGRLDVAPETLGAPRMGNPMSESPATPGFGIYVTRRSNGEVASVVGRVGSGSNARGVTPFDGGYFVLYVGRTDTAGFVGGWASSTGTGVPLVEARGYFCASRLTSGSF